MKSVTKVYEVYVEESEDRDSLTLRIVKETKALKTVLSEFETEQLLVALANALASMYDKDIEYYEKEIDEKRQAIEQMKSMKHVREGAIKEYEDFISLLKEKRERIAKKRDKIEDLIFFFNDMWGITKEEEKQ